ncbi:MAG: signal peptidase II [Eubacteriales bacterium]|nr:signal peptidase II [Eubacteriales bacterium]
MKEGGGGGLSGRWLFFLPGILLILTLLDQATKLLGVLYLKGRPPLVLIPGVLELSYLENRGIAFGLFQGRIPFFLVGTLGLFALGGYVFWRIPKTPYYLPLMILMTLLFSGALGNFMDRCFRGYVVDFIYVSLIDFPVFNLADVYVVLSVFFLMLFILLKYRDEHDFDFLRPGAPR